MKSTKQTQYVFLALATLLALPQLVCAKEFNNSQYELVKISDSTMAAQDNEIARRDLQEGVEGKDFMRYGVSIYQHQAKSAQFQKLELRGGVSELSRKADAGVEVRITW